MVREEAQADAALRAQFGARWTRTASAQLTEGFAASGDKYRQIIDNAVRADNIVRDKYLAHKEVTTATTRYLTLIVIYLPSTVFFRYIYI